jgi:hypothetical protein
MDRTERLHYTDVQKPDAPRPWGPCDIALVPRLMSDEVAAAYVGLKKQTLRNYRSEDMKRVRALRRHLVATDAELLEQVQAGELDVEEAAKGSGFQDRPVIRGPRWLAFGLRRVPRYEREDMDRWVDMHRINPIHQEFAEDSTEPVTDGGTAAASHPRDFIAHYTPGPYKHAA